MFSYHHPLRRFHRHSSQLLRSAWICTALLISGAPAFAHDVDALVFTATEGTAHPANPTAITALQQVGAFHDIGITETSDPATFISELANHDVVVFLNNRGDILNSSQESAFQSWYQAGGSFVGIHAALEAEEGWSWYGDLVGATPARDSNGDPILSAPLNATIEFLDQVHPLTNVIDSGTGLRVLEWSLTEDYHSFDDSPRGDAHVLALADELSEDHPIIWCREFDGGRTAYLGMGGETSTYSDSIFRDVLTNAIEWAAGQLGGDSGATVHGNYEKVVLDNDVGAPMSLDVAPDGKIYFVERKGAVKAHDQTSGITTTIGLLDEYSGGEYGLMGIALAPDFATSQNLYIMWSPNPGTEVNTRVSRFTLDGSGNLNLGSEVVVLEFFTNRPTNDPGLGHHQAGCIRFDTSGNLVISTGDNANHSSFGAMDDNDIAADARKSSANTNDLRGKFLRITPDVGGGPAAHPNYTIPAGNLFPPGTPLTRPEIYAMGARNPFRFCIDPDNGWIYWGEVGPDAGKDRTLPFTGSQGYDEFNQMKQPGFYGWPYFCADNKNYLDGNANPWTMPSARSDLSNYVQQPSFINGGTPAGDPSLIPDPEPAWIWYAYGDPPAQFSDINVTDGRCAMAGAVYDYAPGKNFPAYHDRTLFLMEWSRNDIYEVKVKPDGTLLEISDFAPNLTFSRPMDMVFGADGAMYLIEWGAGFSGNLNDTALVKIQYTQDSLTPIASGSADVTSGGSPLTVQFSSAGSFDPDGGTITYEWDFDGDGTVDSTAENPSFTYTIPGTYTAVLTVTDDQGLFSRQTFTISSGNFAPVVSFDSPLNYDFFDWGDEVGFSVSVTDVEDGSTANGDITGADVIVEGSLGHDDHKHNESQTSSLTGSVITQRDESHPFDGDLAYVLDAFYTDQGGPGLDPILGSVTAVLQPKVTMAHTFDTGDGVTTSGTSDPVGGVQDVTDIDHGDSIMFQSLNLENVDSLLLRAASGGPGGVVTVHQGSPTGNLVATMNVTPTGSDSTYLDFPAVVSNALPGNHDLYFVFTNTPGALNLMRVNWIVFRGEGATLTAELPVATQVAASSTDTILVTFDQAMDLASLSNPSNYSLSGGATITTVTPANDQAGVFLLGSGLVEETTYTLTLNGLMDLAGDEMAPGTQESFLYSLSTSGGSPVLSVNSGGNPVAPDFVADQDFTGGSPFSTTAPITTSGNVPQEVFQT
ncbi:MAG: ThuA domain-containing protein, partial [Verrucomicrobiota bacterium]